MFEKFLPAGDSAPALRRRLLNRLAVLVGTDLNRQLDMLLAGSGRVVTAEQPALFGGMYRLFRLGEEDAQAGDGVNEQ